MAARNRTPCACTGSSSWSASSSGAHYANSGKNPLTDFLQGHHEISPVTTETYFGTGPTWRSQQVGQLAKVVDKRAKGMFRDLLKPVAKGLEGLSKGLAIQARITDQFVPFTATHNYRFSTANTRAAWNRLPAALQEQIVFAPERIDWRDYLLQVHNPGLQENVFPLIEDKMKKTLKPLAQHDDLLAFLDEIAERHDRAPALLRTHEDGFARLSYAQLKALAEAVAVRLASVGVKPGDRVILSGKNHPHWVVSYFGILRAGAVAVPLDVATDGPRAEIIFASAEPTAAIVDSEALDNFGSATDRLTVVDLHDACARGAVGHLPELGVDFTVDKNTLASILYTSGTTGDPKGVMLTHGNFCAMMASIAKLFPLTDEDRLLSVLPLHHAFEFTCGMLMPLSQGARIIYLDEITGDRLSYGLQEGRVTAMVGVPALWQLLERRIRGQVKDRGQLFELFFDRSLTWNRTLGKSVGIDVGRLLFGSVHSRFGGNVRLLISGGAALPKDTQKLFSGLGLHLSEGYGLTEASPVLTVALPGPGGKTGTVGKPVPGVEVKIHEPDDSGIGEVWAKGPNVMTGYFGNPSATQGSLSEDGWLRTGDMGKLDHKGRLTLVGRAKEVVVTSSGRTSTWTTWSMFSAPFATSRSTPWSVWTTSAAVSASDCSPAPIPSPSSTTRSSTARPSWPSRTRSSACRPSSAPPSSTSSTLSCPARRRARSSARRCAASSSASSRRRRQWPDAAPACAARSSMPSQRWQA